MIQVDHKGLAHVLGLSLLFTPGSAFSQTAPFANAWPAGPVTTTNAMLNGFASPNGLPGVAWFEWGAAGNLGQRSPTTDVGSGTAVVRVQAFVSGLAGGRSYEFRLAVSNSAGVVYSAPQRFATGRKVFAWGQNYQSYGQTNFPPGLSNIVAVSANIESSLALGADGTVRPWGYNYYYYSPPPSLQDVATIACGGSHDLALKTDGSVVAWAYNGGSNTNVPASASNVVAIAAGGSHSLALRSDGAVVAWGYNGSGQATVPGNLIDVVAIAAGSSHSLAVRANGTVVGWGENGAGQRNVPIGLSNVVAVAGGYQHSLALRRDGRVVGWGSNGSGQSSPPLSLSNVIAIAAGYAFSVALKSDGTVVTWGVNPAGTNAPRTAVDCSALSAGWYSVLELGNRAPVAFAQTISSPANHDVTIAFAGNDPNGDRLGFRISSLPAAGVLYQYVNGARGPAIASSGTMVIDPGGRVIFAPVANAHGPHATFTFSAHDGEMDSEPVTASVALVGAPYAATRPAVRINSTAATFTGMATPNGFPTTAWFEWGPNYEFATPATNVGSGSAVVHVTARVENLVPRAHYAYRLAASNQTGVVYGWEQRFSTGDKVTAWGYNQQGQTTIPSGLHDVVGVDGGTYHSIALKADGTILGWGEADYDKTNAPAGLNDAISIAAGGHHNLALRGDGTVVAWGFGGDGQTNVPPGLNKVVSVSGGSDFSVALRADGTIVAWGGNVFGQTNVPANSTNVTAIAAGPLHTVALKADGTVGAWGYNGDGRATAPPGLSNVVAVGAAAAGSAALKADGTLVRWGHPSTALGWSNVVAFAARYTDVVAIKRDGTLQDSETDFDTNIPQQLRDVPLVAGHASFSLALGNVAPVAESQTVTAAANHDAPISLSATDINGETLVLRITAPPTAGTLLQHDGTPITSANTVVSDPSGRVIFRPDPDTFGGPYATFGFAANDGDVDSAPATVTVTILGDLRVATQRPWVTSSTAATLNGMVLPNGFPTLAWFEWSGGETAPVAVGSGSAVVHAKQQLTGLALGETLWCRLVAFNANGTVYGAWQPFSTGKKLAAWGKNDYGEGKPPAALAHVTAAAGGWVHSAALRSDGTVAAWGDNSRRQTNVPAGLSNVVAISAESYHTLALKGDGTVTAWGADVFFTPGLTPIWSNIIAIASGQDHVIGLMDDGTVVSRGSFVYSPAIVPAGLSNVVAIAANGNRNLALRADGTVMAFGDAYNNWLQPPPDLSNVVAIATSWSHSLALRADGTVVAWGDNSAGQTNVPAGLTDVVAIACRQGHNLALKADGTVVSWGDTFVPPSVAPGLNGVVAIAEGNAHSLAIGGNVAPEAAQQTVFAQLNREWLITLSGTDINSDALSYRITTFPTKGRLYQVGNGLTRGPLIAPHGVVSNVSGRIIFVPETNEFGRPYTSFEFVAQDGTTDSLPAVVQVIIDGPTFAFTHAADPVTATTATLNGVARAGHLPSTIWFEWGATRDYGQFTAPRSYPAGSNLVWLSESISGLTANAVYHCRLVVSNVGGIAYGPDRIFTTGRQPSAWGNAFSGETRIPGGLTNAVALSAGRNHVLALQNDRTVVGWGENSQNQINVPPGLSNVVAIAAGDRHSLALQEDGRVVPWGRADFGLWAAPTNGVKRIAAGYLHSLALMSDGRVRAWGYNQDGQTNVPIGLSNVVAIAAGSVQSMALRSDGQVIAWGGGASVSNVPPAATNVVAIACSLSQNLALKADRSVVIWGTLTNVPSDWTNLVDVAGLLALKHNGTVSGNPEINSSVNTIPARLTNVAVIASTYQYAVTIGNLPPNAHSISNSGAANHDLQIQLTGSDPQYDPLSFRIVSLPSKGALYQFSAGGRGAAISEPNTAVTDGAGRVIFAPAPDEFADPYASFTFLANDGEMDSTQAVVSVRIVGTVYAATQPAAPVGPTNAVLNGMVLANGFPTTAWFEWGTNSALGQRTAPVNAGAGAQVVRVSVPLQGIASNSVFLFRIVASNVVNVAYGGLQMGTTGKRLEAWGNNQYGRAPVFTGARDVVAIAADSTTTYAIKNDGTVSAWGYHATNGFPSGLSNIIAVAEGLALKSDGTVLSWGKNFGIASNVPPGLDNVIAIESSDMRRMALRADGTVVAWGLAPPVPPNLKNVVGIAVGLNLGMALRADGTVAAWGPNFYGETNIPPGLSNVVAIAAGDWTSLAIQADGRLRMWGFESAGTAGATNLVAAAAGLYHRLAVRANGGLVTWGSGSGNSGKPPWISNVVAVAAGSEHSAVLRDNRPPTALSRSLVGSANRDMVIDLLGNDLDSDVVLARITTLPARGQLYHYTNGTRGVAITLPNMRVDGARVVFVPAADETGDNYATFSFALNDGEADSQPATITVSIVGMAYVATLAPSSVTVNSAVMNGMAVANGLPTLAWFEWGSTVPFAQRTTPVPVLGGAGVVHVGAPISGLTASAEYHFRLVVSNSTRIAYGWEQHFKTGSKLMSWGGSLDYSQAKMPAVSNVIAVAAGDTYSLALLTDSTVKAWGAEPPDMANTNVPPGLSNVVAIAAGPQHALALRSNGTVISWGGYRGTTTNVPANVSNIIAIAAGNLWSVGLRENGTLVTWGSGAPIIGSPPFLPSNIVAVAAGYLHILALRIDGIVLAWGPPGSTNVPGGLTNVVAIAAAGQNNSMALRDNGTVTNWGNISAGTLNPPANLNQVIHIAAGENHRLALRANGSLVGWGNNDAGRLSPPPDLNGVVQLSGGGAHTLAVGGNVAPVALGPQSTSTYVNRDVVIALSGRDANGDMLGFQVSPPNRGTLYQNVGGARGSAILAPALLTDPTGRVIFAPELDQYGPPASSFSFVVNDGAVNSAPLTVPISVILPRSPVINVRSSRFNSDGSFRLEFSGDAATYSVSVSTNLIHWENLGYAPSIGPGLFRFIDPAATNSRQRFYRARAP